MPSKSLLKIMTASFPKTCKNTVHDLPMQGATPLVVAENNKVLGVIHLKDIVKGGIKTTI